MKLKKIIKNKKAILGGIITTFVATIIVIAILLIFIIASGFVKQFKNIKGGVGIEKKYKEEIIGVNKYFEDFGKLTNLRFLLNEQDASGNKVNSLEQAFEKSGVKENG